MPVKKWLWNIAESNQNSVFPHGNVTWYGNGNTLQNRFQVLKYIRFILAYQLSIAEFKCPLWFLFDCSSTIYYSSRPSCKINCVFIIYQSTEWTRFPHSKKGRVPSVHCLSGSCGSSVHHHILLVMQSEFLLLFALQKWDKVLKSCSNTGE